MIKKNSLTCVTMVGHIGAALLKLYAVGIATAQLTPSKFFSTASFTRGSCDVGEEQLCIFPKLGLTGQIISIF